MDIGQIQRHLGKDWTDVGNCIRAALKSGIGLLDDTNEAILEHGGKQLRPLLSVLVARACSSKPANRKTVTYAAAAEILHNATLLHDDVADESDSRRGVPTVRSLMGPTVSVLVGDYWLSKAVEMLLDEGTLDVRVLRLFSATIRNLAEGEMIQLEKSEKLDTQEEDCLRIIYCKTASLFEASIVAGAISADASSDVLEAVRKYARALGYAFQIRDDILDYTGTASLGKPVYLDLDERKITLPLVGALVNAPEQERHIRDCVADIVGHPEIKAEVVAFVKSYGGIEYATAVLERYVAEAVDSLSFLPDSYEKEALAELARFTAMRVF